MKTLERKQLAQLLEWKESKNRKPLVIKGARQVGKTWLMKEFAHKYYKNYVYYNFDEEIALASIFQENKNPQRIIELLALLSGEKILPGETMIILDEIQECPAALNALKYFKENANEYHIVVAGSLLGTLLAKPHSYPVGMVNILEMGPMDFAEFLAACDPVLYNFYQQITKDTKIENVFHERLLEAYRSYLIIGGMPEAVMAWCEEKDAKKVQLIHKELVQLYENDFSKYNGKINSDRILLIFRSIVSQLAKENEKFVYGVVKTGARAREFETAIEWLVSAGMVLRVNNVSKAEHPLPVFAKLDAFKLYLFDIGILKFMSGTDNKAIILDEDFQFKGALAENFVLQQLQGKFNVAPFYFASERSEIDFILQNGTQIIPVEVKAGINKNAKSFKQYIEKYNQICALRFSQRNYVKDGSITNIPLYLAPKITELL